MLASALGISTQAVCNWTAVPAHWLPKVARLAGMREEVLRPDLYDLTRAT